MEGAPVFGIYRRHAQAERAIDRIAASGFSHNDISVLLPATQGSKEFATEKDSGVSEGTATGVTAGSVMGGSLGLLAGICALLIPGFGPFIAAGPITAALTGLGVGGAIGGLVGALVGVGIPENEAKWYEERVQDGGVLLSVHCNSSDEISRAIDLLKQTGAEDVASTGEAGSEYGKID